VFDLYSVAADGTGAVEQLTTSTLWHLPSSITPDGTRIVGWERTPGGDYDIITVPVMRPSKSETLFHTPFTEVFPEMSPNGRYIAYQSSESGTPDVYVRPFPQVDRRVWKLSTEGGMRFAWARNGRELFYLDGSKTLTAVPVQTSGPTFSAGTPAKVFDAAKYANWDPYRNYDVSPDGQRFLMIKDGPARNQLIVVERFFEELKARVPPGS
jgi:serine/threonine-protein kinase